MSAETQAEGISSETELPQGLSNAVSLARATSITC